MSIVDQLHRKFIAVAVLAETKMQLRGASGRRSVFTGVEGSAGESFVPRDEGGLYRSGSITDRRRGPRTYGFTRVFGVPYASVLNEPAPWLSSESASLHGHWVENYAKLWPETLHEAVEQVFNGR